MNKFKLTKIEYDTKYNLSGNCPHCNMLLDFSKQKTCSDDIPPDHFEKYDEAWKKSTDDYLEFIQNNPIMQNLTSLRQTWNDTIKETLPAFSKITSETTFVLSGMCPYCDKVVELRRTTQININSPPCPDLDIINTMHILEKCPICNNVIHVSDGEFYIDSECNCHPDKKDKIHKGGRPGRPRNVPILTVRGDVCKNCGHPVYFGLHYRSTNHLGDKCGFCPCEKPEV